MIDVKNRSDSELGYLHTKIHDELQTRSQLAVNKKIEQDTKDIINSDDAQMIKAEIIALEAEFAVLPEKIDLHKSIELKLSAVCEDYSSVIEMLDNGCENLLTISVECANKETLPEDLRYKLTSLEDDIGYDQISAEEMLSGYDSLQWKQFIEKVRTLEEKTNFLYSAGINPSDLFSER